MRKTKTNHSIWLSLALLTCKVCGIMFMSLGHVVKIILDKLRQNSYSVLNH